MAPMPMYAARSTRLSGFGMPREIVDADIDGDHPTADTTVRRVTVKTPRIAAGFRE